MVELSLWGGRDDDAGLLRMNVLRRYRTMPDDVTGFAVNVSEAYARFAQGSSAVNPIPDFAEAMKHRLLNAIARAAAAGGRI